MRKKPVSLLACAAMLAVALLRPAVSSAQVELDSDVNTAVQAIGSLSGSIPYVGPFLSLGTSLLFKEKEQDSPAVTLAKANNFTKDTSVNDKIERLSKKLSGYQQKMENINRLQADDAAEQDAIGKRLAQSQATNAAIGPKIGELRGSIDKLRAANEGRTMSTEDTVNILRMEREVEQLLGRLDTYTPPNTNRDEIVAQWHQLGTIVETAIPEFELEAGDKTVAFLPLLGAALNLRLDAYDRVIILETDAAKQALYLRLRIRMTQEYNAKLNSLITKWIAYNQSLIGTSSECGARTKGNSPSISQCHLSRNGPSSECRARVVAPVGAGMCIRTDYFATSGGKRFGQNFTNEREAAAFAQKQKDAIAAFESNRWNKHFAMESTSVIKVENFAGLTDEALAEVFGVTAPVEKAAIFWVKDGVFKIGPLSRLGDAAGWQPTGYGYVRLPTAHARATVHYFNSARGKDSLKRRKLVGSKAAEMKVFLMPHFDPWDGDIGVFKYQ